MKLTIPLKKIHFIGIGGIGMSAIAEMLRELGVCVQGSDAKESANTIRLTKEGIKVFIGHDAKNIMGADAIVISSAIKPDNPELLAAQKTGLPIGHRSEMLAEILRYKQSICVGGTHGKTTTSSIIASILMEANLKPSFIIGGILNSHKSNARLGRGNHVVVETDESDGSFLRLPTNISVVTNIDPEHMEYYKTFDTVKAAYTLFIEKTSFYGFTVACADHPVVRDVIAKINGRKIITYGFDKSADVHADHLRLVKGITVFDVFVRQKNQKFLKIKDVSLSMLGRHNVSNALAAIAVALQLGIKESTIKKALLKFEGIQRRLTKRGCAGDVCIFDDYAHHPTEINACLASVKESTKGKVVAVFQPHKYTRFHDLWSEFLTCFSKADTVVVCDVYAAGEPAIDGVSKEKFARALSKKHADVHILTDFDALPGLIKKMTRGGDNVVCLGAGSITAHATALPKALKALKG
ncbi:MAG: UDP-N-acetylmuramate--L-alanine ligase [Lactobacillales bacterium]|jgi:UDP-N-acetylmuramate--alanine ligase|nr:UDP-N-acetylmuramate--L-alanine ligase [Lactobacillales bacterium]